MSTDVAEKNPGKKEEDYVGWFGSDPLQPDFRDNLYAGLKNLREVAPVNLTPLGIWRVTRYKDIQTVLKANAGKRNSEGLIFTFSKEASEAEVSILNADDPRHTRLRDLLKKLFTPSAIRHIYESVEIALDKRLDEIQDKGEMDIIKDVSLVVSEAAVCTMLGIEYKGMSGELFDAATQYTQMLNQAERPDLEQELEKAEAAERTLEAFIQEIVDDRRKNPIEGDIITGLIKARDETGELESERELLMQVGALAVASLETSAGVIGNGMLAFMENPEQLELLHDKPELIDSAVEECLRYDTPTFFTIRCLREDLEIGDFVIPEDNYVLPVLSAGNRDPEMFTNPDEFDITRDEAKPLSFGGGRHMCLGSHLARMTEKIAFSAMSKRFTNFTFNKDDFEWAETFFRVYRKMPVKFELRK